jgi:WD40 repeat protein
LQTQAPQNQLKKELIIMEAFISYSRKNKEFVQNLAGALKQANREVWIDWEDIPQGAEWWQEIEHGIEVANAFLFVLSPDSITSEVCIWELNHALKHNKRLIPILHQEVEGKIPQEIKAINWIFFRETDDFNQAFSTLLKTLDTDLERVRKHTRILRRAVEWEAHQHDNSFLLHGKDLNNAQQWLSRSIETPPQPTQLQTQYIIQSVRAQSKNQNKKLGTAFAAFIISLALGLVALYEGHKAKEAEYEAKQAHHHASLSHIRALTALSEARLANHDELGGLLSSVKATKQWEKISWLAKDNDYSAQINDLENQLHSSLKESISETRERNRLELHVERVQTLRFRPKTEKWDKNILVSGASDDTIIIWNQKGKPLKTLKAHQDSVYDISISPKGDFFASASGDKTVKIWNFKGELLDTLKHIAEIHGVSISPDAQKIAIASDERYVGLWHKKDEKWERIDNFKFKHDSAVQVVRFSHDGQFFASASSDRTVKLWQVTDSNHLLLKATLIGHQDRVYAVSFSPDNQTLASASADNTIRFWKLNQITMDGGLWDKSTVIQAHSNWVFDIDYNPKGNMLASASASGSVKLWSRDGTLLKVFKNPKVRMTAVAFNSDGKWLASAGGDNTIRLYDLEAGTSVKIIEGHQSGLKDVDVSYPNASQQTIASTGTDGTVRLWESQTYQLLRTLKTRVSARDVDYIPHSDLLAVTTYENTVQFWPIDQLSDQPIYTITQEQTQGKVRSIAFNSKKPLFATTQSNMIQLWKLKTKRGQLYAEKHGKPLDGHKKSVNALSFSPDGQHLASGSADHTAIIWYFDKTYTFVTRAILEGKNGHESWINNLGFSPDSRYLATASSDHTIKLWDVKEGEWLASTAEVDKHQDWVWDVSFASEQPEPKHYRFVSGSADNTIKVWHYDAKENKITLLRTLKGHEGWVRAVGFSNTGHEIISASADKTVRFWEWEKFKEEDHSASLKTLVNNGCQLLKNYLENNEKLEQSDRQVCQ